MRVQGLQGVRRGKRVRATIADDTAERPLDRVNRQFHAARPGKQAIPRIGNPEMGGLIQPSTPAFCHQLYISCRGCGKLPQSARQC